MSDRITINYNIKSRRTVPNIISCSLRQTLHFYLPSLTFWFVFFYIHSFFSVDDKTAAPDGFSNGLFFPHKHFETTLVMVRVYGYDIWHHNKEIVKQFLSTNSCSSTSFKNRSKAGGWNDAKCLFMLFYMSSKKDLFIAVLTWFLILGKIQDGDHCWWRHRPPAAPSLIKYTPSCWEDQRLSTEGKTILKYCKNSGEGFHTEIVIHSMSLIK